VEDSLSGLLVQSSLKPIEQFLFVVWAV
jgi:hypothetical protein